MTSCATDIAQTIIQQYLYKYLPIHLNVMYVSEVGTVELHNYSQILLKYNFSKIHIS